MEQYIIYVQDTETTGLIPGQNEIIECSFIRLMADGDDFKEEQKSWLIKALKPSTIQEEALKVNGHKKEDILWQTKYGKENYILPSDAVVEIENWIAEDKMSTHDRVFAGQNPMFDFEHFVELWKQEDAIDTFPFHTGHNKLIIDTKHIALFFDICNNLKRERYNLGSLVSDFGVKKEKAHRADGDTRMTKDLLVTMVQQIRKGFKLSKDK
jgi:DNA polymerase III alpha subunit (gram-positive type)